MEAIRRQTLAVQRVSWTRSLLTLRGCSISIRTVFRGRTSWLVKRSILLLPDYLPCGVTQIQRPETHMSILTRQGVLTPKSPQLAGYPRNPCSQRPNRTHVLMLRLPTSNANPTKPIRLFEGFVCHNVKHWLKITPDVQIQTMSAYAITQGRGKAAQPQVRSPGLHSSSSAHRITTC